MAQASVLSAEDLVNYFHHKIDTYLLLTNLNWSGNLVKYKESGRVTLAYPVLKDISNMLIN